MDEEKGEGVVIREEKEFEFEGVGFVLNGEVEQTGEEEHTFVADMYVDGELVETSKLPSNFTTRKQPPFWRYQLKRGKHVVRIKVHNPSEKATLAIYSMIIYDDRPVNPKY